MVVQDGYSLVGRSRGRMTPYVVCIVHKETRRADFLVEPQNQGWRFVSGLASKPLGRFVSGLASKSLGRFLPVWPQNRWRQFSPVWSQNRWRRFLPVWSQNQWWWVSWIGPQNRLLWFGDLGIKITAMVSWFMPQDWWRHNSDGTRGIIVDVASRWSWRWSVWWHRVRRSASWTEIPFVRYSFLF
jgi:hypothetical protein